MKQIEKKKLSEWAESPTTAFVAEIFEELLDQAYTERCNFFLPNEPWITQEKRARLLGLEQAYQDIIDVLTMNPDTLNDFFDGEKFGLIKTAEEVDIEHYGE